MSQAAEPRWRVWFRHLGGVETYVDVDGFFDSEAIQRAHHVMRERTDPPLKGWWMDRWQRLACPVGRYDPKRRQRVIDGPPLRHRLRMRLRRLKGDSAK